MRRPAADPGSLRSALSAVLSDPGNDLTTLGYADTSVRFRIPEDGEAITLLLDRDPPVMTESGSAEATITLDRVQAMRMAAGTLPLAPAIVAGEVHADGPVRQFLQAEPILRRLLAAAPGTPAGWGSAHAAFPPPRRGCGAGPIDRDLLAIQSRNVHKSFGSLDVLKGVDLAIPEGVIAAVIGPSGTGKSVLLQHVIGVLRPDAGDIAIRGTWLSRMSRSQLLALRTEIGVMFQDGALFSSMNVYDNVAFPLRQHTDLSEREVSDVVHGRLAAVGLSGAADQMPASLSGGMKKRAGLARALVLEPSIVLCDEPDSGLDPVRTALLGDLLIEQHAETGGTMLVITHNIPLARRVADHISVLVGGRVLTSGLAADVFGSDDAFVQQFLAGATDGPLGMD